MSLKDPCNKNNNNIFEQNKNSYSIFFNPFFEPNFFFAKSIFWTQNFLFGPHIFSPEESPNESIHCVFMERFITSNMVICFVGYDSLSIIFVNKMEKFQGVPLHPPSKVASRRNEYPMITIIPYFKMLLYYQKENTCYKINKNYNVIYVSNKCNFVEW